MGSVVYSSRHETQVDLFTCRDDELLVLEIQMLPVFTRFLH